MVHFFCIFRRKIINKDEIPSKEEDNLYDFEIAQKIKLYLIIQIISLVSAFINSYFLMYEKKEEDILEDIKDNNHIIRNDIQTEDHIENEHINKKEINIKNNITKKEPESDKDINKFHYSKSIKRWKRRHFRYKRK